MVPGQLNKRCLPDSDRWLTFCVIVGNIINNYKADSGEQNSCNGMVNPFSSKTSRTDVL